MERKSYKIAIAAVGASIAALMIVLSNLLPLSVSLLTFAAVCYYIVFDKAGIAYGFLCIAAASAISFMFGIGTAQLVNLILFVPYAILAYFIRKLKFDKIKTTLLRAVIIAVFANLEFMALFLLATHVLADALAGFPILGLVERLGGWYVLAALTITAVMIVVDIGFCYVCRILSDRIKIGKKK